MIPGWTPPKKLKAITPAVYGTLRVYIETGCVAVAKYIENSLDLASVPILRPRLHDMARLFYDYVPADAVPLAPAQALKDELQPDLTPYPLIDEDRPGWPTFVSRTTLITALDSVTPPEVLAKVGPLDGPPDKAGLLDSLKSAALGGDDSGAAAGFALEWWTLALAASGVLWWLGRTNFAGLAIGLLARRLLKALVVGGALILFTDAATKMIEKFGANAAGAARSIFPIVLAGGAAALGVVLLVRSSSPSPSRQKALVG